MPVNRCRHAECDRIAFPDKSGPYWLDLPGQVTKKGLPAREIARILGKRTTAEPGPAAIAPSAASRSLTPTGNCETMRRMAQVDAPNERHPRSRLRCAGHRRRTRRLDRGRVAGRTRSSGHAAGKDTPSALSHRRIAAARQPAAFPSPWASRIRFAPSG